MNQRRTLRGIILTVDDLTTFFYFQPVNSPANQEDEEFKEKENDEKMEKEMTKDC